MVNPQVIKFIIIFLFISNLNNLTSIQRKIRDYSKGPLYGKNMYLPFLIYYNFPGHRATGGGKFEFQYHISLYYSNDFHLNAIYFDEEDNFFGIKLDRDYESFTAELGASFFIIKNLQVGMDIRLIAYYGGFLDNIIQEFHYGLNLPNAGREYTPQDQVYINIFNKNNVRIFLNRPTVSFGDMDLWAKYTFFQKKRIALAVMGVLKIPTGQIRELSGSGFPDFGIALLADFKPIWILSFYLQTGLVVPYDSFLQCVESNPYPMFNGLVGVELNPTKFFSFIVQLNIKSSPMISGLPYWRPGFNNIDYLSLPQINTLVGFIFSYDGFKWQLYVEEDSFTNAGTDITFNLSFSHTFRLRRR